MSKYYKIVPIKHLLKNNKMAKSGDVVDGSSFVNLQDSLDRGFCKETNEKPEGFDKIQDAAKKEALEAEKAAKKSEASGEAEKAAKKAAKAAKKALEAEEKAAAKAALEAKKAEEAKEVDLNEFTEKELIDFAKKNDFKLTAQIIKLGRESMIEAIISQNT